MKPELHLEVFEERKETIYKWGIEAKGIEKLSYGSPKPIEKRKEALSLFEDLEKTLKGML